MTDITPLAVTRGYIPVGAPTVIGFTGKMGSGKDTLLTRLQHLFGEANYRKASYAETLKESMAALFGVTVEMLEAWKNEPTIRVSVLDLRGAGRDLGRSFSIRELLQRYGTEAHREIPGFGPDVWVQAAIRKVADEKRDNQRATHVFTDVRFENEARAIVELGGLIYEIEGPPLPDRPDGVAEREATHASEGGIPRELIHATIDNSYRPEFDVMAQGEPGAADKALAESLALLDDEAARIHSELQDLAQ